MNLYVGNLSYQVTEEELKNAFGQYGEVKKVSIVKDRETGESRGFAFVEMMEGEAGKTAMAELNGAELRGRRLRVNEAMQRTDGPRGGGGGGERRGGGGGYGGGGGNRGGGGGYGGGGGNRGGGGGGNYGGNRG